MNQESEKGHQPPANWGVKLRANKPKEVTRTPEYPQLIPPDPNNVYYNFPQAPEFYPYMYSCWHGSWLLFSLDQFSLKSI